MIVPGWLAVQEVNSVEAIKSSVEANLGVAFVSAAAIEKEVELGRLHAIRIRGLPLARTLLCVTDPARYCSKAARALIRELFGLDVQLAPQGCFLPNPRLQHVRPFFNNMCVLRGSFSTTYDECMES